VAIQHKDIGPRRQGAILLVVKDICHRRRPNRLAGLEAPQRFSVDAVGGQYGTAKPPTMIAASFLGSSVILETSSINSAFVRTACPALLFGC
jgi:hypothetical protein